MSEIVSEMLCDLSQYFHISYYDVLDNHSRLEPNKKDSLELETLVRIIPWYVKERLKENKNVEIKHNTFADDVAAFNIYDFKVAAVHGHKDSRGARADSGWRSYGGRVGRGSLLPSRCRKWVGELVWFLCGLICGFWSHVVFSDRWSCPRC